MIDQPHRWSERLRNRFRDFQQLGQGRMSTVVTAVEISSGRQVALKILHDHLVDRESIRRRLRRELAAVRRLDHRTIVGVDDLIEDDDVVALIMEFVEGESVRARVERAGPMDWNGTKVVLEDVLDGLQHAHSRGIWHRDLNAEHIMIDRQGRGRIVGFGMARVDELVGLTMHTRVLGALEAMAPERVLGMDYDGRADLYSVGAVAHEMLLGHPPVDATMHAAFAQAVDESRSSEIEKAWDELPRRARYLLERSLVGDMSARFATADQMRRALEGGYDEPMWRGWEARQSQTCPDCEAPVIDGLDRCLECEYQFRRLIQEPGAGDLAVQVISRYDDFEKDVAFEINTEPRSLTEEQVYDLMDFLEQFEDTRYLADGSPEYRYPPYFLFDELSARDAARVSKGLAERGILHRVWSIRSPRSIKRRGLDRELSELGIGDYVGEFARRGLLHFADDFGATRRGPTNRPVIGDLLRLAAALIASVLLVVVLDDAGASPGLILSVLGCFFISVGWARAVARPLETEGPSSEKSPVSGPPRRVRRFSSDEILPRRTGEILRNLEDDFLRRELYELLVLSTELRRRLAAEKSELVDELIRGVLDTAVSIDRLQREVEQTQVNDVLDELERLGAQADPPGPVDDVDERDQEREHLLHTLEKQDRTVHEMTMARAKLLSARGVLLDLRGGGREEGAPIEELVDERLEGLEVIVEATDEVEQITEGIGR